VPKKLHENSLGDWPVYMTKDIIDLWRSEGGIGKIVFSLVIPAFLIWEILDIFNAYVIRIDFVVFFAIFFSILSASIYNWLTEFDTFTNYTYLPAGIGTIISEKFRTFLLLNSISFAILLAAAVIKGEYGSLLPAALCLLGLSVWSASTIVLIGGLSPNVMLYDPKIFIAYIALNLPFVLAAMIGSLFATWYVALSVLLVLPAWLLVKAGIHRAML